MIDVHPPHAPTHTWRDFFIHIATICIGLLIAIALEQSVETIHRHHQRQELLEQLDAEHRQILKDATDSAASDETFLNWYAGHIASLQAVITQHQPYAAPPRPAIGNYSLPADPVWRAAKASGLTSLLPQQVVIANSEPENLLNREDGQIMESARVQNTILITACGRLPLLPATNTPDYIHADIHDLRDCLAASMSYYAVRRSAYALKIFLIAAARSILDGETDVDRISDREVEAGNAARTRLRPVPLPR
jgi:hypothetical protein